MPEIESLDLLMKHGADPAIKNDDGKRPTDIAADGGHEDVARRLAAVERSS